MTTESLVEKSFLKSEQVGFTLISPATTLVGNLYVCALDDTLDVSGQMFALQIHRQRHSGEDRNKDGMKNVHLK